MLDHYLSKLCNDVSGDKLTPHKMEKYVKNNNMILEALNENNKYNVQVGGGILDPSTEDQLVVLLTQIADNVNHLFNGYDGKIDIDEYVKELDGSKVEYTSLMNNMPLYISAMVLMLDNIDEFSGNLKTLIDSDSKYDPRKINFYMMPLCKRICMDNVGTSLYDEVVHSLDNNVVETINREFMPTTVLFDMLDEPNFYNQLLTYYIYDMEPLISSDEPAKLLTEITALLMKLAP